MGEIRISVAPRLEVLEADWFLLHGLNSRPLSDTYLKYVKTFGTLTRVEHKRWHFERTEKFLNVNGVSTKNTTFSVLWEDTSYLYHINLFFDVEVCFDEQGIWDEFISYIHGAKSTKVNGAYVKETPFGNFTNVVEWHRIPNKMWVYVEKWSLYRELEIFRVLSF